MTGTVDERLAAALRRAAEGWPYRGVHHDKGFRWEPWTDEAIQIVVDRLADSGVVLVERTDSLDAAWAEAEAALPEGWRLYGVQYTGDEKWSGPVWRAWAGLIPYAKEDNPYNASVGSTPAAALRALAEALR